MGSAGGALTTRVECGSSSIARAGIEGNRGGRRDERIAGENEREKKSR